MRPRPNRRSLVAVLAAIFALLVVAGPSAAQVGPLTPEPIEVRQCIAEARRDGLSAFAAGRACIPDEGRFVECVGGRSSMETEIEVCIAEQIAPESTQTTIPQPGDGSSTTEGEASATTAASTTSTTAERSEAQSETPSRAEDTATEDEGYSLPVLLIAALGGLIVGAIVARLLAPKRAPEHFGDHVTHPPTTPHGGTPSVTPPSPGPVPVGAYAPAEADVAVAPVPAPGQDEANHARVERDDLVLTLIDLADQVQSEALRTLIVQRLASVGVDEVRPAPGDIFDPLIHKGVHSETAEDPEDSNTVAALDRPGWVDRGRTIRPPEVIVNLWEEDTP